MSTSWQPPPVRWVRWGQNKTQVEAACALAGLKVVFQDGWAVIVASQGPGRRPNVTFCDEGQVLLIDTVEVLTVAQFRERCPGALP